MAMAFGTSSSAATLPVTMSCAATNGLDEDVINFVFPLGATVNMDGSAIYYCQVVIYISALIGCVSAELSIPRIQPRGC